MYFSFPHAAFLFLFFLLIFPKDLEGKSLNWIFLKGQPWLAVSSLEKMPSVQVKYEKEAERLAIEGEKGKALLLLEASYATIQGRFIRLKAPFLMKKKGELYLHMGFVRSYLIPLLKEKDRSFFQEEIRRVFLQSKSFLCALDRPVQRIFLDPGHGGKDVGGRYRWAKEKELVLFFSKRVKKELEKEGFVVKLSRSKDEFIPLDLRPSLAKEWGADVFISIHANSSPSQRIRGVETYILSEEATDVEARKLALMENQYIEEKRDKDSKKSTLRNILWDVQQMAYLQDSAYLASHIQSSILGLTQKHLASQKKEKWRNRGVREAPFLVLSHASMPSVLLELGYISNPKDRNLLWNKKFQKLLAKGLVEGVKRYAKHCIGKK